MQKSWYLSALPLHLYYIYTYAASFPFVSSVLKINPFFGGICASIKKAVAKVIQSFEMGKYRVGECRCETAQEGQFEIAFSPLTFFYYICKYNLK